MFDPSLVFIFLFLRRFPFILSVLIYERNDKKTAISFGKVHLHDQVVRVLVALCLRDRTVFEEGFQGGHLPVVEGSALSLRGQGLPRYVVRRVHRAQFFLPQLLYHAAVLVSRAGSTSLPILTHIAGYSGERRRTIRTQTAQIPVKVAGKTLHFWFTVRQKTFQFSVQYGLIQVDK